MRLGSIEQFEQQYRIMGENYLGTVRPMGSNSWFWFDGEDRCVFVRSPLEKEGLFFHFSDTDDNGLKGREFIFKKDTLLRVLDVAISAQELEGNNLWNHIITMSMFERDIDPLRQVTDHEQAFFWQALRAPLQDIY